MNGIPLHKMNWGAYGNSQVKLNENEKIKARNSIQNLNRDSVKLKDLCSEDKFKIGELAKKLSDEKKSMKAIEAKLTKEQKKVEFELQEAMNDNKRITTEMKQLKNGFDESLGQIKQFIQMKRCSLSPIRHSRNISSMSDYTFNQNPFKVRNHESEEQIRSKTPTLPPRANTSCNTSFESERRLFNASSLYEKSDTIRCTTPSTETSFSSLSCQSTSTQTSYDKIIQVKISPYQSHNKQTAGIKQSTALREVKNLQNDLFNLSKGVKDLKSNCVDFIKSSNSYNSQANRNIFKPSEFFQSLGLSNKNQKLPIGSDKENIFASRQNSYIYETVGNPKNKGKKQEDIDVISIDDKYYDDQLFKVLEEIDK
ncbi:unnamed protein product [Blepharisma stoltei]|uniref:Uncharacterized protein n=1 Tax=Blepharisma stoltei TaxID=1481888 RepID=A0AAU9IGL6_9CILI|nr:unnamed protein product [Blepharisma stoltei]